MTKTLAFSHLSLFALERVVTELEAQSAALAIELKAARETLTRRLNAVNSSDSGPQGGAAAA